MKLLAEHYDKGNFDVARDMANTCHRTIVEELIHACKRRDLRMWNYALPVNERNLLKQSLTTGMNARFQGFASDLQVEITHIPAFQMGLSEPNLMPFVIWWNMPVLIAGAATGILIPVKEEDQIPFVKRPKWSIMKIIDFIRNNLGAHFKQTMDNAGDFLRDPLFAENIGYSYEGTNFSLDTDPDRFRFLNHPLHAVTRHISHEIIESLNKPFIAGGELG